MRTVLIGVLTFSISVCFGEDFNKKKYNQGRNFCFFNGEKYLNINEGTIEAWIYIDYDLRDNFQVDPAYRVSPFTLCFTTDKFGNYPKFENGKELVPMVDIRGSNHMKKIFKDGKLIKTINAHELIFLTNLGRESKDGAPFMPLSVRFDFQKLGWEKKGWHFIAFTWKRNGETFEITGTCDGATKTKSGPTNNYIKRDKEIFILGAALGRQNMCKLDTFKLSDKVRSIEELQQSIQQGIKKDASAKLFHSGESLSKLSVMRLRPEWIRDATKKISKKEPRYRNSGSIFKKSKTVEGKFNKAITFYLSEN